MDAKDVEIARLNAQLVIAKGLQSSTAKRKPKARRSGLGLAVVCGLALGALAGAAGYGMGFADKIPHELTVPGAFGLGR